MPIISAKCLLLLLLLLLFDFENTIQVVIDLTILYRKKLVFNTKKYYVLFYNIFHVMDFCKFFCLKIILAYTLNTKFKERNFASHYVTFFSESLFVKPNHTLILLNQSGVSTSELVSSLSACESKWSLTSCLLTFCN